MVSTTIRVEGLGKSYQIGGTRQAPRASVKDSFTSAVLGPLRRTGKLLRGQAYGAAELDETIWAIRDLNFSVEQGEVLGVIGRNGAGKTTLLRILSRITDPTEGSVELQGRVGALLEVGTGFHAELTGRENTFLNGAILGMRRSEIQRKFDEIVDFSGVEKFIDTPVKHYSTGMQVRLAFAVAAHLQPDILLVDEVLAVGDYEFQRKCLGKMGDISRDGRTVLLVSHQLNNIAGLCSRCILLEDGKIAIEGETSRVLAHYVASVRKSAGEVVWDDPQSAPGNEKVRLHAVQILNSDGQVTPDLDIQEEIVLKVSYWNLKEGNSPKVSATITGQMGEVAFTAVNLPSESALPDSWFDAAFPVGLFETECRFPANLFNTVTYTIHLQVDSTFNRPFDINEGNILSFTVHDLAGRDTSGIAWQGAVRPKFPWKTEYMGNHVQR